MKKILLILVVFVLTMSMPMLAANTAQAIWCAGNKTLYFTYQELVTAGSTFDDQTVTYVWSGDDVTNSGTSNVPHWAWENMRDIIRVKFINTFVNVEPTSLYNWFWGCKNLTTIEGIEYLNTSKVTTMCDMFHACGFTSIDISQLEDCSNMFWGCAELKTIYCNKSWTISADNSAGMFWACNKLSNGNGVNYNSQNYDGTMACPLTGYFTPTTALSGIGTEDDPFQIATADHWNMLSEYVATGRNANGLYFQQTGNFTVDTMIGTETGYFSGNYDGNSRMLTANIDGTASFSAPFAYIENASIRNVFVDGSVKGGEHSAGLVGNVVRSDDNTCTVENCNVRASVTCIADAGRYAGGVIGHGHNATLTVRGCAFTGTIARTAPDGQAAGAIMGWRDLDTDIEVTDCYENGTYTNFSHKAMSYILTQGTVVAYTGTNCYNTHNWNDGSIRALEVTDNTGGLIIPTDDTTYRAYNTSLITVYDNCMTVQLITGYGSNGAIDSDTKMYAQPEMPFTFNSPNSITVKNTATEAVIAPAINGYVYSVTMPSNDGITLTTEAKAYAIWCAGNSTLYFDMSTDNITAGSTYKGQTVTAVWSGKQVTETGRNAPAWSTTANTATKVVFTPDFASVRPKSLCLWFKDFTKLCDIEGIANLNTSACTNFNSAFFNCNLLKKIDVDGFDASKVTNSTSMFYGCDALQTIFCNKAWTHIESSSKMFSYSSNLSGADSYNDNRVDASMANPNNGYFTKKELTLANSADNSAVIEKFSGIKNVEVTLAGRTLSKDGNWNTLCLPFDVTEADGTPLSGATIMELDTSSNLDSEGILTLNFTNASSIEAGKPYIVKWETQGEAVSNPEFTGVTVTSTSPEPIISTDTKVTFVGQYSPFTIVANGVELEENQGHLNEIILLSSGNRLGYSQHPRTLNCFRAHFYVPAENGATGVRSYALNFAGDGTTTGIIEILNDNGETTNDKSGTWFSIDGRKLSGKPTTSGLYINNGKKIIVK